VGLEQVWPGDCWEGVLVVIDGGLSCLDVYQTHISSFDNGGQHVPTVGPVAVWRGSVHSVPVWRVTI
jgi:hypothetical protein